MTVRAIVADDEAFRHCITNTPLRLQWRLTFVYGKQARFAIGPIGPTRTLAILEIGTLAS